MLGTDAASKVTALSFLSAGSIRVILGLAIEIWVFVTCFHTCFFFPSELLINPPAVYQFGEDVQCP